MHLNINRLNKKPAPRAKSHTPAPLNRKAGVPEKSATQKLPQPLPPRIPIAQAAAFADRILRKLKPLSDWQETIREDFI